MDSDDVRGHVFKLSRARVADFKKFEEEIRDDKTTLHVLIHDEAHWGFTADGAHADLVRTVLEKDPTNLIKVAVSATPYNHLCSELGIAEKDKREVVAWDIAHATEKHFKMYIGIKVRSQILRDRCRPALC